ncbi:hypothetical protein B9Z19DRAFT_490251 [Tuber borchii]|uniref:Uncharacterized protein n=1 Tax=Tuber borchii TaxID=42251 RepID=A0A2T6ZEU7_TUBBO|nr:hypothetical protein B9Z19DRAFT_490251 [Tuber borchii]
MGVLGRFLLILFSWFWWVGGSFDILLGGCFAVVFIIIVFILIISPFMNPAKLENGDIRDYSYHFFLFLFCFLFSQTPFVCFQATTLVSSSCPYFFCSTFHPFNSFILIWRGPVKFGRLVGLVLPGLVNSIAIRW